MRSLPLLLIAVSGLLVILGGGDAFIFRPLIVKQIAKPQSGGRKSVSLASSSRRGPSSELTRQTWLADLMKSWFKLTPPDAATTNKANKSIESTATDEVRTAIRKLRDSNAELRAEVLALRTYMLQRGFTPVEDVFADPSPKNPAALLPPTASPAPAPAPNRSSSQPTQNSPPMPREARLAVLALLWAAAVCVGGVFVPVAIREGATQSLRWLDDGGTLIPAPIRRVLGGYRVRWRRKGWGNAVLSYIPVLARVPKVDGEGSDGEKGGGLQGDALAGAWEELNPRKRRRRSP